MSPRVYGSLELPALVRCVRKDEPWYYSRPSRATDNQDGGRCAQMRKEVQCTRTPALQSVVMPDLKD